LALLLTFEGSACNILPYSSQCSLSSAQAYPVRYKSYKTITEMMASQMVLFCDFIIPDIIGYFQWELISSYF
jgi:hypothetical protein